MFSRTAALSVSMLLATLAVATAAASPALAAPNLAPSPAALQYGEVDLHNGGTPQQSVSLTQIDPETATTIESVAVVGSEASSFQVTSDGCSGAELENGKSCSVEIAFHPAGQPAAQAATLEVLTAEGPVEVPLTGSAITGTLSASPPSFSPIPFTAPGSHNEGENSETEQLNIQNSSNAATQVLSTSISGPDAASFSIQWNCNGTVIGASNSCGMGVRFQPTSPGPQNASLEIFSDSATSPLVIPLSGVGLHGPHMTLNTSQALLGPVTLGSTAEQVFDVSNTGDYPLFIQRTFLVTGTPLMFPIGQDTCTGAILYPSEACAVHISFAPTTLGEKSGALLFITNTPAINVAGIDGIGVAPEPASVVISAPTHAHTSASAPASTTPAPSPAAASPPASEAASAPTPPAALSAARPLRLFSLLGRLTLDPGADLQCPASTHGCEALSFVVASGPSHGSARARDLTPALLGTSITRLHAGEGAHVRVPLTRHAIARLKQRGHMYVRVGVVLQAGGAIVAQRTWTVKLTAAGAVSRVG
jgi:hypothetical protein